MSLAFPPRLIVFDLDGTLIDSRVDLCNSVNATLAHLGKPTLPEAVISGYIGDGASMLVRRAIGDPEGDSTDEQYVTKALTFFLNYYRIHKLDYTYVYPGVLESLEAIRAAHPEILMAVLTNKPVTELIVESGRCTGVRCADGDTFRAEKAVVSTIHIKHLVDMAPTALWGQEFLEGVDRFTISRLTATCSTFLKETLHG